MPLPSKDRSIHYRLIGWVDRLMYMTRLPALESDYVLRAASVQRIAAEEVRE